MAEHVAVVFDLPQEFTLLFVHLLLSRSRGGLAGIVGTLWPVIIPNWFGDAFSIFLLREFFLTIPEEDLDAARVDGLGELRVLTSVVVRALRSRTNTCVRPCRSPPPRFEAAVVNATFEPSPEIDGS